MENLQDVIKSKNECLVLAGAIHSGRAYTGPQVLHIDLTNRCNYDCLACWCRSPLLGDKAMPDWEKKLTLPFPIIRGVIDDLAEMGGLEQVKLVGGGEPFMHPDILAIVAYIKSKIGKVDIDINTNFSLVTKESAARLIDLNVDMMTVSLWAGSPGAYAAVHPNQAEDRFLKIREVLEYIRDEKKRRNVRHPRIVIHDVVFKPNHYDVRTMLDFGLEVGADGIQFVPMDPIKGKTDELLPSEGEKQKIAQAARAIKTRYDSTSFRYTAENGQQIILSDFDAFLRRVEEQDVAVGAYDESVVDAYPCYVGWLFARIMGTGNVVPCCKGHRMHMGNIYEKRFRDIWFSETYDMFRRNGIHMTKSDPYFSLIGNEASKVTGCYNCDNLWQNIPLHNKIKKVKAMRPEFSATCGELLKAYF
jgi:MoaA/NifB/PqqE/SkfB family radical SAM enzyme